MLQKKELRIVIFECENIHSNPLFFKHKIIKFPEKIIIGKVRINFSELYHDKL